MFLVHSVEFATGGCRNISKDDQDKCVMKESVQYFCKSHKNFVFRGDRWEKISPHLIFSRFQSFCCISVHWRNRAVCLIVSCSVGKTKSGFFGCRLLLVTRNVSRLCFNTAQTLWHKTVKDAHQSTWQQHVDTLGYWVAWCMLPNHWKHSLC